ncbi:MAG: LURP-one-related family protein [Bacteroidota bacterium]
MGKVSYQLKRKIWSFNKSYDIFDEAGDTVFQVVGKPFSWGNKLSLLNIDGEEILKIKQTMAAWKATYELIEGDMLVAILEKEFSWFKRRFTLDIPGPNDYTIKGDFWAHEFTFERSGETVARVSKDIFKMSDTYGVRIREEEDHELILATVVVVNLICAAHS